LCGLDHGYAEDMQQYPHGWEGDLRAIVDALQRYVADAQSLQLHGGGTKHSGAAHGSAGESDWPVDDVHVEHDCGSGPILAGRGDGSRAGEYLRDVVERDAGDVQRDSRDVPDHQPDARSATLEHKHVLLGRADDLRTALDAHSGDGVAIAGSVYAGATQFGLLAGRGDRDRAREHLGWGGERDNVQDDWDPERAREHLRAGLDAGSGRKWNLVWAESIYIRAPIIPEELTLRRRILE